jgi:adenylyltransferase/sulfurtransferase
MSTLSKDEIARYSRHFPVIGLDGQETLKAARVLCIGAGGLGCPVLQYLAAAGVGTLGVVDGDAVELSNLQRQVLFRESDVGQNKAETIVSHLQALNSQIEFNSYPRFLDREAACALFPEFDLIIDATDNYKARFLINEVSRDLKKPLVSASIYQFDAQVSVFNYQDGPCYQCLYPEPPPAELTPNCAVGGVLGVLPGVIGTLQATEVIKVLLNKGTVLSGTLLSLDLLSMRFNQFKITKQDCKSHPLVSFEEQANSKPLSYQSMYVEELRALRESGKPFCLLDVREPYEREISHMGGEHIPLGLLEEELARLNSDELIVVHCKSGVRSASACKTLLLAGFKQVYNLEGGILAWIDEVEPELTKY